MASFGKPENALKRAKELIAVNQKTQALQVMHEVLSSKKHRQWQDTLEKIMKKYIKLSVEMRQQKRAKDGLHQYRMICSQTHLASLEKVIRYFLKVADKYARDAQSKADKIAVDLSKIEDLDAEDAADSVISASQDDTKDRTDREIVTPWLKFLWETYRTVLEILRNNQTLEALYQETAQQAYNFCLKYKRTTEFRRLAEILRNHLFQTKSPNQQQPVTLSSPESLNLHLETRFVQLNVAMDLELWQEAFRSIEDIHGLMTLAKKAPKPQLMASYYQKLTQIFWVSNNHLFHAYAWYKYYALTKAHKQNLTTDEIRIMTSSVLLAALSIPMPSKRSNDHYLDVDVQKEKNTRLAALLGFSINPKRDVLLSELASKNISALVLPELKDLYNLLEKKFHPLELCAAVKPKLDFIAAHPQLNQYHKPLEKLLFTRLLQQLSKVYQVMKLSELQRLASFADAQSVERWTIEAVKNGHIEARLDHQTHALSFGSQVLESEKMRTQLTELSKNLQLAVEMLHPEAAKAREERKAAVFAQLVHGAEEEHKRILARKANIEKRKELQEMLEKIKAKEDADRIALSAPPPEKKPDNVPEAPKPAIDTAAKDAAEARQDALDKLKKARQALDKKMTKLSRRLDYLERARRDAEKPILQAAIEKQKVEDATFLEDQMRTTLERHKKQHQAELEEKRRLSRMVSYKAEYEARIAKRREEEFAKAKAQQDARMADVRASIEKLREKRKIAEEKRRVEEERARKQREEEERARREAEEKRRAEEAARQKKLEEQAEMQRRREQEALEKQRNAVPAGRPGAGPARDGAYRPSAEREGAYRPPAERTGGAYRPPAEREREGGYRPEQREREGAYRPSAEREREGGYRPPVEREGGYRPPMERERPVDEGGWRRPAGERPPPEREREREGGSRPPAEREPAYRPMEREREGGYRPPAEREGAHRPPTERDREGAYRPPMDRERPPTGAAGGGDRWRDERPGDRPGAYRPPGERAGGDAYRPPERRGDGGAYRPPGERGGGREDYPPPRRDDGPRRDDYPPTRRDDGPRGGPPPAARSEPRKEPAPAPSKEQDDDGFTTVKRGARPAKK